MSRITRKFKALKKQGKKAFIPYIMAGDPSLEATKELVLLLEECGADIVELGVPFSDPLADGPVIQRAAERAIAKGVHLKDVITLVKEIRQSSDIPIVLMTYYNPVFKYGEEAFTKDAASAGVDGLIVPDLPPDEAETLIKLTRGHGPRRAQQSQRQRQRPEREGLDMIFLLAPTSTAERMKKVAKASRGFIYYVAITGITGASLQQVDRIGQSVAQLRGFTQKPVAVGFGVKTPEDAGAVAEISDGVIVGSEIVKKIAGGDGVPAAKGTAPLKELLLSLREAIR